MENMETQHDLDSTTLNEENELCAAPQGEIVLGTLSSIDENGQPCVSFQLDKPYSCVPAIATIPVSAQHIGRQVGLLFAQSTQKTPVVVGVIHNPLHSILDNIEVVDSAEDETIFEAPSKAVEQAPISVGDALVDGNRVVIEGKDEVVLKCGEASITLNKNGKISIRGKYLLNRSTGVNRIMGGSVQVN